MFFSILLHNCKNIISSPAGIVNQAVFLVILLSIFAFFGVESPVIGYNLIWMSLLFAMMLNMNWAGRRTDGIGIGKLSDGTQR